MCVCRITEADEGSLSVCFNPLRSNIITGAVPSGTFPRHLVRQVGRSLSSPSSTTLAGAWLPLPLRAKRSTGQRKRRLLPSTLLGRTRRSCPTAIPRRSPPELHQHRGLCSSWRRNSFAIDPLRSDMMHGSSESPSLSMLQESLRGRRTPWCHKRRREEWCTTTLLILLLYLLYLRREEPVGHSRMLTLRAGPCLTVHPPRTSTAPAAKSSQGL